MVDNPTVFWIWMFLVFNSSPCYLYVGIKLYTTMDAEWSFFRWFICSFLPCSFLNKILNFKSPSAFQYSTIYRIFISFTILQPFLVHVKVAYAKNQWRATWALQLRCNAVFNLKFRKVTVLHWSFRSYFNKILFIEWNQWRKNNLPGWTLITTRAT